MEKAINTAGMIQMTLNDLRSLKYLVDNAGHKPKLIEIGCWAGYSTVHLGTWVKRAGGHMWTIDTFDGASSELSKVKSDPYAALMENLKTFELEDTVTVIRGKSDEVLQRTPDDVSMVFIDGDHRYDQVSSDIKNYRAKIERGIICGHDLNGFVYDVNYINVDHKDQYHHGVAKAVLTEFRYPRKLWDSVWFNEIGR